MPVFSARELSSPTEYGCSLGGGHCYRLVTAGRQHHHRVERFLEQRPPVGEAAAHPVTVTELIDNGARQIAQGRNLKAIIELPEVMQVHHLRDEPTADDANSNPSLSQTGRDYTP